MSKTTAKQRYTQLKEWMITLKSDSKTESNQNRRFSKADHYKAKRAR